LKFVGNFLEKLLEMNKSSHPVVKP